MLSETKLSLLQQLVQDASKEEIIWAKGYLAGFFDKSFETPVVTENGSQITVKPTIIYGTETGNAKKVAFQLLSKFKKNKIQAKAIDVFQFNFAKLEKESLVLFIVSTQGEGEFPLNAKDFYEKLQNTKLKFPNLKYAVFGLGDSSYPLYCHAGVLLDKALEDAGGKRILPLVKADVNYIDTLKQWEADLQNLFKSKSNTVANPLTITNSFQAAPQKKDFKASVDHKIILNDRGSNKETYHIELSSEEQIPYEPGDSLGIIPKNDRASVAQIISVFKEEATKPITIKDETNSIEYWLTHRNIKGLGRNSYKPIAELLKKRTNADRADLIDILSLGDIPEQVKLEQVIELLLPIAPRLYSISSSREAHEDQIHLTVNLNKFKANGQDKTGLASKALADFPLDTDIEFYIHQNPNFKLPSDDTDIIMIGPGTGIAPFRSFISQRDASGAEGKNWLFFGEQHFVHDFYYQTEIQEWLASGVLSQFDVAFSRDQQDKIYVQDRIAQKSQLFYEWLENGAYLYICGQKNPMSIDVENTIISIISQHKGIDKEAAREFLENMEIEGRYQKDVY